jgi:hypothetical protein
MRLSVLKRYGRTFTSVSVVSGADQPTRSTSSLPHRRPFPLWATLCTPPLAVRLEESYVMLHCRALTNQPSPVTVLTTDSNGVVLTIAIEPGASGIR